MGVEMDIMAYGCAAASWRRLGLGLAAAGAEQSHSIIRRRRPKVLRCSAWWQNVDITAGAQAAAEGEDKL